MVLSIQNLHVWRGETHVLRGLSFDAATGCCVQVRGANGAGKTTLLRTICGLVLAEEGAVHWNGADVRRDARAFHQQSFYLAHDVPLKADLTGHENLRYVMGVRRSCAAAENEAALARVGAQRIASRQVRTYSAGQRRRLGLAMLLLAQVPLWILDEPTAHLDTQGQSLVAELIGEQLERGGLVVAAVHHELPLPAARLVRLDLGST